MSLLECPVFILAFVLSNVVLCDPVVNDNFNSSVREYSSGDNNNVTNVKTLQKEESGRHANFAPIRNPIKFKEIPDSDLSSSSHARGLLYHEPPGYGLTEYEESPNYKPHGYEFEYPFHDSGPHEVHIPPTYNLHGPDPHHFPTHHYSGHGHYKHYHHALATKTLLWPIAGIALLGAAAALVSNPVLLQLGVISGKRKRRDTDEVFGPDFTPDTFREFKRKFQRIGELPKQNQNKPKVTRDTNSWRSLKLKELKRDFSKDEGNVILNKERVQTKPLVTKIGNAVSNNNDEVKYIPIPVILRHSDKSYRSSNSGS